MGKSWDSQGISFQKETWEIIRKACLSGSPLLSFGGSRTQHRIACAIEDAGWEIRDTLMWVYGSGFPKSLDISKAIDKRRGCDVSNYIIQSGKSDNEIANYCNVSPALVRFWRLDERQIQLEEWGRLKELLGIQNKKFDANLEVAKREVIGVGADYGHQRSKTGYGFNDGFDITKPSTLEARLWEGYGTALKPAYEPIILAMNPLDGTFANNALKHKVAGLNIDGCRIEGEYKWRASDSKVEGDIFKAGSFGEAPHPRGRFPANFLHDGSQMVMELFPNTKSKGHFNSRVNMKGHTLYEGGFNDFEQEDRVLNDNGSVARFFYCAKASKAERDRGLEGIPEQCCGMMEDDNYPIKTGSGNLRDTKRHNSHPTVKPLALMEYLVKLVKMPEYNLILDPFCGSGTTLLACIKLGIPCIGIDSDEQACEIAARRCSQEVMELV
jgi:hypothetical protein